MTDAGSFSAKIQQITNSGLRPRIKYGVTFFRRSDVAVISYAMALRYTLNTQSFAHRVGGGRPESGRDNRRALLRDLPVAGLYLVY